MKEKTGRGYDLPLTTQKLEIWFKLLLLVAVVIWMDYDMRTSGIPAQAVLFMRIVFAVIFTPLMAVELGHCYTKVHLVNEGVAVTLFGRTIQRISRGQLRQILGVQQFFKYGSDEKWLVVSVLTVEELAEIQAAKTRKMFLNGRSHPRWAEDLAEKYFRHHFQSLRWALGIRREGMIFLEWSPERLTLFREMYPEIPWADLSDKKVLSIEQ